MISKSCCKKKRVGFCFLHMNHMCPWYMPSLGVHKIYRYSKRYKLQLSISFENNILIGERDYEFTHRSVSCASLSPSKNINSI